MSVFTFFFFFFLMWEGFQFIHSWYISLILSVHFCFHFVHCLFSYSFLFFIYAWLSFFTWNKMSFPLIHSIQQNTNKLKYFLKIKTDSAYNGVIYKGNIEWIVRSNYSVTFVECHPTLSLLLFPVTSQIPVVNHLELPPEARLNKLIV